jgi:hypothetical protein
MALHLVQPFDDLACTALASVRGEKSKCRAGAYKTVRSSAIRLAMYMPTRLLCDILMQIHRGFVPVLTLRAPHAKIR